MASVSPGSCGGGSVSSEAVGNTPGPAADLDEVRFGPRASDRARRSGDGEPRCGETRCAGSDGEPPPALPPPMGGSDGDDDEVRAAAAASLRLRAGRVDLPASRLSSPSEIGTRAARAARAGG